MPHGSERIILFLLGLSGALFPYPRQDIAQPRLRRCSRPARDSCQLDHPFASLFRAPFPFCAVMTLPLLRCNDKSRSWNCHCGASISAAREPEGAPQSRWAIEDRFMRLSERQPGRRDERDPDNCGDHGCRRRLLQPGSPAPTRIARWRGLAAPAVKAGDLRERNSSPAAAWYKK